MTISGDYKTREVRIDGKKLSLKRSLKIRNHSPTGFCWGYEGSGPAQLSLAILLQLYDRETAEMFYQDFKRKIIARIPMDANFEIPVGNVIQLIDSWKKGER